MTSAPRDGSEFFGWKDGVEKWKWQSPLGDRPVGWRSFMWVYPEDEGPTHWQPIPQGPESTMTKIECSGCDEKDKRIKRLEQALAESLKCKTYGGMRAIILAALEEKP